MESISRNVRDSDCAERHVLEIVDAGETPIEGSLPAVATGLPEWCNVFEGLSDAEIAELETVLRQRANFARAS